MVVPGRRQKLLDGRDADSHLEESACDIVPPMQSASTKTGGPGGGREPSSRSDVTVPQILIGWLLSSVVLLCVKWRMLGDTYYWDELACYFAQVFEMVHRLDHFLASHPPYVRSPLMTSVLALLHRYVSESRELQHGTVLVVAALSLPATYALTCQLGGSRRTGILAALLCGLTPAFFAQAGMVQMDLPATGVSALAFVCVLRRNWLGYALLGGMAVLIKESTYWVCLASAVLVFARLWKLEQRSPLAITTLLRLWPTAIPGVVLFLWLLVHRHITGAMVASDHTSVLSVGGIWTSMLHNLIEGRRLPLTIAAGAFVIHLFHRQIPNESSAAERMVDQRIAVFATVVLWLTLPLCFPGQLVRYMMPTLPALCALGALGVSLLPSTMRMGVTALLALGLVSGFRGDSWHANSPSEIEGTLSYRLLLHQQMIVAQRIADAGARRAVADFPFENILGAAPIFGYLDTPLAVTRLGKLRDPAELCASEVVVVTQVSVDSFPLIERAVQMGILKRWFVAASDEFPVGKSWYVPKSARYDHTISVYRVACPAS